MMAEARKRGGDSQGQQPSAPRQARISGPWFGVLLVMLCIGLILMLFLAVSVGSVTIPFRTVWAIVYQHLAWFTEPTDEPPRQDAIVWLFRVPRALLAAVVGGALAVAGTALQASVRNPLAEPYVLGVVQGASFGAVLTIAIGTAAVGGAVLSLAAFAGAMVALLVLLLFGRRNGQVEPVRLILAGVAVGYVFYSLTSYVQLRIAEGNSLAGVLFWLLGTVAAASWSDLGIPAVALFGSTAWLLVQSRPLNALLAGDETATALGVDPGRFRLRLLIVSALLTGTVVAVAGGIGFVGLMIPHTVRLIVGSDHRRVLPVAVLLGANFMVLVDLGARVLARPIELPLTVVTAAVGAPFFLWLMRRSDRVPGQA